MFLAADSCDKSLVCVKTETEKKFCYYIEQAWPTYDSTNNPLSDLTMGD